MTPTKKTLILISQLVALSAALGAGAACGSTDAANAVTGEFTGLGGYPAYGSGRYIPTNDICRALINCQQMYTAPLA